MSGESRQPRSIPFSAIAARTLVEPSEAAALVLAAVAACDRAIPGIEGLPLPGADRVLLHHDGRVTVATPAPPGDDEQRALAAATLLRTLLALGTSDPDERPRLPGPLLILLARTFRTIDLPAPSFEQLCEALRRFSGPDEFESSRGVYARAVSFVTGERHTPERPARTAPLVATVAACVLAIAASAWLLRSAVDLVAPDGGSVASVSKEPAIHRQPGGGARAAAVATGAAFPATAATVLAVDPNPPEPDVTLPLPVEETPRPLLPMVTDLEIFSPAFHRPDELVFHRDRNRGVLLHARFDGNGAPRLTTLLDDGASNYHPVLSPDGARLAFDSDRDGTRGVYVARRDGSDAVRVSGEGFAAVPRWSPDGRQLAFVRGEPSRPRVWNVWIAELPTGRLTRISRHSVGQAWSASWFPDGRRLAYTVEDRLVIVDLRSGDNHVVRSPVRGALVRTPAVSPDGDVIAVQVHRHGVWLFDVGARSMRRVARDPSAEEFSWTPDGERLAFHSRRGGRWSLWQVDVPQRPAS